MAFVLGAAIGSFLNVCIYRLPLDLSVNRPSRSFCPIVKTPIPWHQNIPLVSWLVLRGRCAHCGNKIAFRYFGVELLTALLFLLVWQCFPWPIAIAYWVFVSLVIVATFIDFEHFIIPDQITIGGTVAGLVASLVVPELMHADSRLAALIRSALRPRLATSRSGSCSRPASSPSGENAFGSMRPRLLLGNDRARMRISALAKEHSLWSEYFARESDRLCSIATRPRSTSLLRRSDPRVLLQPGPVGGENFELDHVTRFRESCASCRSRAKPWAAAT